MCTRCPTDMHHTPLLPCRMHHPPPGRMHHQSVIQAHTQTYTCKCTIYVCPAAPQHRRVRTHFELAFCPVINKSYRASWRQKRHAIITSTQLTNGSSAARTDRDYVDDVLVCLCTSDWRRSAAPTNHHTSSLFSAHGLNLCALTKWNNHICVCECVFFCVFMCALWHTSQKPCVNCVFWVRTWSRRVRLGRSIRVQISFCAAGRRGGQTNWRPNTRWCQMIDCEVHCLAKMRVVVYVECVFSCARLYTTHVSCLFWSTLVVLMCVQVRDFN